MTRLRVAFVHERYPSYRHELFRLLAARYDVEFFFVNEPAAHLPPRSRVVVGIRVPEMSDFTVAPTLRRALLHAHAAKPFDLILGSDLGSYATGAAWHAAREAGVPFVLWSGEWVVTRHPRRLLMHTWEARVARGAAACLAYGTRAASYLVGLGAQRGGIFLTGNTAGYACTPAAAEEQARFRSQCGIGDRPVVLYLGRLIAVKAPDVLVRAFAEVAARAPATFLVVAGEGPQLPELERLVKKLAVPSVHFTRRTVEGQAEKDLLYSLADIFVLPSRRTRIAEAWGLVLNEAANAGLPIVASQSIGAVGDLIRSGETGLVVPESDPHALAEAILRLLQNADEARRLGEAARVAEKQFTIERMASAFAQAFDYAAGARA